MGCGTQSSLVDSDVVDSTPRPRRWCAAQPPCLPPSRWPPAGRRFRRGVPGFSSATEVSRSAAPTWRSSRRVSSPRPNNAALACSTASVACSPCTRVVSSLRQPALCRALLRSLRRNRLQFGQLVGRQEGEPAQVPDDVGVGGVDEVLVPGIRAGHLGVQPQVAAAGGLAELRARRRRSPTEP